MKFVIKNTSHVMVKDLNHKIGLMDPCLVVIKGKKEERKRKLEEKRKRKIKLEEKIKRKEERKQEDDNNI
tara:strand:+ start:91 stop:300 length:210 start_codon:yes stop_codon:yes gene_type:complete